MKHLFECWYAEIACKPSKVDGYQTSVGGDQESCCQSNNKRSIEEAPTSHNFPDRFFVRKTFLGMNFCEELSIVLRKGGRIKGCENLRGCSVSRFDGPWNLYIFFWQSMWDEKLFVPCLTMLRTCHVATPLWSHGSSCKMDVPVWSSQEEKVLHSTHTHYVSWTTSDVWFITPVLDIKLDRISCLIPKVTFKLILKYWRESVFEVKLCL